MPVSVAEPMLLMTMKDIAELAGVQRPVVSNWRRRDLGFPNPIDGNETQPMFSPQEVAEWLLQTRRINQERAEQELSLFMLTGLAARYEGPDTLAAVTALIGLRYLVDENEALSDGAGDPVAVAHALAADSDPEDHMVLTEISSIPPTADWLVRLVDDLIEASWNCREAFERVMAVRHRFGAGAVSAAAVAPALTRLIAELSGAAERARRGGQIVVKDPAAGPGDLIATVAHLLGPDNPPVVMAAESDPVLARLVRRRLLVHGIGGAGMDVRISADLPEQPNGPDVVVTQVPYQSGEARDVATIIDHVGDVAVQLSPGRYGVVLGPAAVLTGDLGSFSPEERARADLLKNDMVEAIIRLPGGLLPFRPGYETALWVLTQARDSRWRGRVLLADVSDRVLTHAVITDLVEDIVTWRRDGYMPGAHHRAYGVQVAVGDLVDRPGPLLIGRRSSSPRGRRADASTQVTVVTQQGLDLDRIGATASGDRHHVTTETLVAADLHPPTSTIGALAKRKRLVLHRSTRIRSEDVGASGHHVVLGADEVLGIRRPGQRRVDREVFARTCPNARLTEPGDVLVTMTPRPGVMVDHDGYTIAEFPVRILRIPAAEAAQFTPRVLTALLFGDNSGGRAEGAVRAGRALEDHRIPLLSTSQVRQLDQLLAQLDARRDLAQRELDAIDQLQQVVTDGLIDGTLTFASDEANG